jgi:hypothetical protein
MSRYTRILRMLSDILQKMICNLLYESPTLSELTSREDTKTNPLSNYGGGNRTPDHAVLAIAKSTY